MRSATPFGGCEPALRFVSMPGSCSPTTCIACGACRKATPTSPAAGARSRSRSPSRCRLRTAIGGDDQPRRTRYLAAPLLGAHNPRPAGFRPPFRLHPFQSGQARSGRASGGLALLDVSPLRCQRNVSKRLGGRWRRTGPRRRATVTAGAHTDQRRNALRCSALRLLLNHILPKAMIQRGYTGTSGI